MANIDTSLLEAIIGQIPTLITAVWWAARQKSDLEKIIDSVKDNHDLQIRLLDKTVSLLTQEFQTFRSSFDEKLTGQGKRFGSKFERLEDRVNEVIEFKVLDKKIDFLIAKSEKE
jgi:hypothetical protein